MCGPRRATSTGTSAVLLASYGGQTYGRRFSAKAGQVAFGSPFRGSCMRGRGRSGCEGCKTRAVDDRGSRRAERERMTGGVCRWVVRVLPFSFFLPPPAPSSYRRPLACTRNRVVDDEHNSKRASFGSKLQRVQPLEMRSFPLRVCFCRRCPRTADRRRLVTRRTRR